ncbi:MAG: ATP-binding protein [Verrucomicrobia bacterium]|nr:ATP-binding protein [Verrucomicrobiota bacterium]
MVNGDRDALAQVLVNLIANAEKYCGLQKQITTRLVLQDRFAELQVLDRGLGVPSGCEEKIFEQFFRAHDALASGIPGSGLGLTLARQIARAHGGEVTHAPRDGGGSVFTLRMPLSSSTAPAPTQPPPPAG